MMKKTLAIFMILLTLITLSSCGYNKRLPEYESGYFKYAVSTYKGTKTGYLVGFTESGLQQKSLILPTQIDGITIIGIGYEVKTGWMWDFILHSNFESDTLEKLYIDFDMFRNPPWNRRLTKGVLKNCFIIDMKGNGSGVIDTVLGVVGTYHEFLRFPRKSNESITYKLANISFMYNYGDAPNEGCYWIDSYNNDVVNFIPPIPIRESYTFGGWYKETECVNKWSFENDKVGDEIILTGQTYAEYPGIYLYAKWI